MSSHKNLNINIQVLWLGKPDMQVTWELADSSSSDIIKELEKSIRPEVITHKDVEYGHQKSILSVSSSNSDQDIPQKNSRIESPIIQNSIGKILAITIITMASVLNAEK